MTVMLNTYYPQTDELPPPLWLFGLINAGVHFYNSIVHTETQRKNNSIANTLEFGMELTYIQNFLIF